MSFYIDTIEQIVNDDKSYSEYGKREKVDDQNTALSKYYKKLSDVSADIGKKHTYMCIQIVNSKHAVIKQDCVGDYVSATK